MEKSFSIPSAFEENYQQFKKVASTFMDGIKIMDFNGKDYIIGDLALKEGLSPHKFLNSSAQDIDYQLLGLSALLIATQGTYSNLIVTTGFSFSTFMPYRNGALNFFKGTHEIKFDTRTVGGKDIESVKFNIPHIEVIPEIEGSIKAIREGEINEKQNFFVASLGFGTFETALSTPSGIIHRTSNSARGISYAVNVLENQLQKHYYLNLINDTQLEKAFQRGSIVVNRKRFDLSELRDEALQSYYNEVVSPAMRKKFTDEDFNRAEKIYLVGGGAMYDKMIQCFKDEFRDVIEVIVFPEPYLAASKGYCIHSMQTGKDIVNTVDDKKGYLYVGLDIGNSSTIVTVDNNF